MLSEERRNQLTPEETAIAFHEAATAARQLGQSLVSFERNPNPMREREARSPADGIRIRLIRPEPISIGYADADSVRAHNDFVSSLGRSGRRFES